MFVEMKIKNKDDVQTISDMAAKQDFEMYVSNQDGTFTVNAKSILALFALIGKRVRLVAPDHLNADKFIEAVRSLV